MIDDLRRMTLAYLLMKGPATERSVEAFIAQRSAATGGEDHIVRELLDRGYIERDPNRHLCVSRAFRHFKSDFRISLTTPSGNRPGLQVHPIFYTRGYRPKLRDCFVIMPFHSEFDDVYRLGIRPGIEDAEHRCRRADDIYSSGPVMERVWHYLVSSWIVVADVTSRNANVLYELGIAHSLGREVILLTQRKEDIPFDLRAHRRLTYDASPPGLERLRRELTAAIRVIVSELA